MRLPLLFAGLALAGIATPARAEVASMSVAGTWQTLVPAAITSYNPSAADPTKGAFTAVGSTVWRGDWTGITTYTMRGTVDLVTSASTGTLEETFTGSTTSGGTGTLHLTETFTIDSTGNLNIQTRILGGTGVFARSRGRVEFLGKTISIVTGSGTYDGRWSHPDQAT
ncbi:MAG: hypothetical protein NVS3B26_22650 [Mycobacteriales bacterium]